MNEDLRERIAAVTEALIEDPDGVLAGEIPDGNPAVTSTRGPLDEHRQFLRLTDGPRCGAASFWCWDDLCDNQQAVALLPGGDSRWLSIGQVAYEPLVVDTQTGQVHWVTEVAGAEGDPGQPLGTLYAFLRHYIFGEGYAELGLDVVDDDWYNLLMELSLA